MVSRQKILAVAVIALAEAAVAVVINQFTDDMRLQFGIPLVLLFALLVAAYLVLTSIESHENDGDRRELAAAVAEAVLPKPPSRLDLVYQAHRDASARREVRLLTSVPDVRVPAVLDWMSQQATPDVQVLPGQLRVLVGHMGAGKSEIASRWWDQGLDQAVQDDSLAIPLWLPARQITNLRAQAEPPPFLSDSQARVVIDDLDSVTAQRATEILDEARELVRACPTMSILATSRPGIPLHRNEELAVEPWSVDKGVELVKLAGEAELPSDFWAPETEGLLTSPLLALAVAARLDAGQEIRVSRFALLSGLARTVVERRSKGAASTEAWADLAQLARRILHDDAPVTASSFGNEAQTQRLASTKLVVENGGTLSFALPLFEQHFGAQWITTAPDGVETAAAPKVFPRWRYALAFAIATSEPARAEKLMLRLARTNPAALSWIFDEVRTTDTTHENWAKGRTDDEVRNMLTYLGANDLTSPTSPAVAAGAWLREAHTALTEGLDPIGSILARSPRTGQARWGVYLQQGYLTLAESRGGHVSAEIVELKEPRPHLGEWTRIRRVFLSARPLARWDLLRGHLRDELDKHISRRTLPVPPGSLLEIERVWFLCKLITKTKSWEDKPIPMSAVWEKLTPMVEQVSRTVHSRWGTGTQAIDSDDVRWLEPRLNTDTAEHLESPWPEADAPSHDALHRYFRYSPELDLAVTSDVFRRAVLGYRDLVETAFPRFGDALGLYSMLPVRVTGVLIHRTPANNFDDGRSLYYSLQRAPGRDHRSEPEIDIKLATNSEEEERLTMLWDNDQEPSPAAAFHPSTMTYGHAPSPTDRRATNLAYEWLVRDLESIGWATRQHHFYD